jgi:hypothetical protein
MSCFARCAGDAARGAWHGETARRFTRYIWNILERIFRRQSSLGIVTGATGAKGENYCAAADVGGLNPSFSALTTRIIDCSYRFKWRIFEHTQDLEAYSKI